MTVQPHTFISPSADSRRAVVSYWQKYEHSVLLNHLRGLNLPRKSVDRLTDHPDMTIDVHRGCKTTTQQQNCLGKYVRHGSKYLFDKVGCLIKLEPKH